MRGPAFASPRRGTLSFVTQKFFCFGAINNSGWVYTRALSGLLLKVPYITPAMVPPGRYK